MKKTNNTTSAVCSLPEELISLWLFSGCDLQRLHISFFFFILSSIIKCAYLVGPGILIPGRELQHSDDFVDLGAHLLEGEVAVLQGLLHAVAARRLGGHKDFDT